MITLPIVENINLKKAVELLRVVTHPLRLEILSFISQKKETTVNSMVEELRIDQSIVSQQIRLLKDMQLITGTRQGKFIFYKVDFEKIEKIKNIIDTHYL